jgi:hypothetical protein
MTGGGQEVSTRGGSELGCAWAAGLMQKRGGGRGSRSAATCRSRGKGRGRGPARHVGEEEKRGSSTAVPDTSGGEGPRRAARTAAAGARWDAHATRV